MAVQVLLKSKSLWESVVSLEVFWPKGEENLEASVKQTAEISL